MAVAAFILGGILGLIGAIAVMLLTGAGWGAAVTVYLALGYGVPGAMIAALLIREALLALVKGGMSRSPEEARASRS